MTIVFTTRQLSPRTSFSNVSQLMYNVKQAKLKS